MVNGIRTGDPVDSIKDVVRSSGKVPEFDKHLKKAGGHIGRNVGEITIKMKTIVRKSLMIEKKKAFPNILIIFFFDILKFSNIPSERYSLTTKKKTIHFCISEPIQGFCIFVTFSFPQGGWGCRIHRLYLWSGVRALTSEVRALNNMMVRFQYC